MTAALAIIATIYSALLVLKAWLALSYASSNGNDVDNTTPDLSYAKGVTDNSPGLPRRAEGESGTPGSVQSHESGRTPGNTGPNVHRALAPEQSPPADIAGSGALVSTGSQPSHGFALPQTRESRASRPRVAQTRLGSLGQPWAIFSNAFGVFKQANCPKQSSAPSQSLTSERPSLPPHTLTIAQAILSGDPLLEARLATNLSALPDQAFVWFIDVDDDEAQRIADALRLRFPHTDLRVETCLPCPERTNPKLWKLQHIAPLLRTPFVCVLDDDTALSTESAATLVAAAEHSAIATGLPCYLDTGDVPSSLLAQFVNNSSVFTYLGTARLLEPFTLSGMGYMMRREQLVPLDNFKPILNELTDDLAMATLVLQTGGRIHQSTAPLRVQTGVKNLAHYFQLMHRWYVFTLLLLRRQSIPVQMLIFALHGLPQLLLIALFALAIASAKLTSALLLLGVLGLRWLVITFLLRRFFGEPLHRPLLSILSELMQPVHLVHASISRTIRWRTHTYRVRDTNDFFEA